MNRLELDFLQGQRRAGWASWVLLGLAVLFLLDLGRSWLALRAQIAQREAAATVRNSAPSRVDGLMRVSSQPVKAGEIAAARNTIRRLSVPWERLFGALEAAQTENTFLLSIEPDGEQGTVTLTGEAKDYLAALSYVANLEGQKGLARVAMTRHEVKQTAPQKPVAFVISASWRDQR